VEHFDRRFKMEDEGLLIPGDKNFRWRQVFEKEYE
jgi:hypothetical protein